MSRTQAWCVAAGVSVLAATAAAQTQPTIPYERMKLDNGLSVILHHDARLPLVAVSVWYDVGGISEKAGRSGFAHLFEHMMFQATLNVPEDQFFAMLEQAGGTNLNGTTSWDRTNYFETVPSHQLELALWLESERMGYLLPAVTTKSLANQIEVVTNERRQSVENAPYGLVEEAMTQALFPKPHPYYGNVIGSQADIAAATLPDVQDFFLTYYSPANATLAIGGAYDPATIKELVQKYFGPLKGRFKVSRPSVTVPKLTTEQVLALEEPVATLARVSFAWIVPPAFAPGTAELELLAHVISGTKSSRLDAKVAYQDPMVQSVSAYLDERIGGSVFQIDMTLKPGRTPEEAKAAADGVLNELRTSKPPTEAELRRAVNAKLTAKIAGLEKLGSYNGRLEELQAYNHYLGDPGSLGWDLDRFKKVTVADLSKALNEHLGSARLVVFATPKVKQVAP
ncbi:MAG: insulinase family protein [Deltaproteobacteria bacterium]|nr:insulinase family protein [Deltaproteobacteria bacterium]